MCDHPFVKQFEASQNDKGFWPPFHGDSEGVIRHLLSYGLDKNHFLLKRVSEYIVKLLHNEEHPDRFEKHDNVRWWPEIFMPLVSAAILSLIDNTNENLDLHRQRWAAFAETSLKKYNNNEVWVRALSLLSQFHGWTIYKQKYVDWILEQRNQDGLWEFSKYEKNRQHRIRIQ